jgi:NAD(P)-dependent dehydrogenase (short-subunit alcohol dehydrogenase family)
MSNAPYHSRILLLNSNVAVVTCSTKEIGLAIAKEFTEHNGATVIVCSRDEYSAKNPASLLNGKTDSAGVDFTIDSSLANS